MCRPLYLSCPFCQAQRFLLWEECGRFWVRYQYIVIDQGNFDQRPHIGRREDEPPVCGGPVLEPRFRDFPLGKCPRLRHCPSQRAYVKHQHSQHLRRQQQHRQQQQQPPQQHKMRQGWYMNLPPTNGFGWTTEGAVGQTEERWRREFAFRYFRKLPVEARPRHGDLSADEVDTSSNPDGGRRGSDAGDDLDADENLNAGENLDADDEKNGDEPETAVESAGEEPASLASQTASAPTPGPRNLWPSSGEGLSESPGSTIIESGSEVDSVDWSQRYKSHKLEPSQSI